MVNQIYPPKLKLNKANTLDTLAHLFGFSSLYFKRLVSFKIHDELDDLDFDTVNFSFFDGDVPSRRSYGVYISRIIRFARVCSHVDDFNNCNKCSTTKHLKQGNRYHKLRKPFSKFYHRHNELVSKFNVWLKSLLHQAYRNQIYYRTTFMVTKYTN